MDARRRWLACCLVAGAIGCGGASTAPPTGVLESAAEERVIGGRVVAGVLPGSDGATCLYGTSDGRGDVALGFGDVAATWQVYARDGAARATIGSSDSDWLHADAYPLAAGFQIPFVRVDIPVHGGELIGTWAADGAKLGEQLYATNSPFTVDTTRAPMPYGGVFTTNLTVHPTPTLNIFSVALEWIGRSSESVGVVSFTLRTPLSGSTGGAVDRRGRTLAWFPGVTGLAAQWLDVGGQARGPQFPSPLPDGAELAPLFGGGFAVRAGDDWIGVIGGDATTLAPAPPWLARRPRTRLVLVERPQAYALLADDGEAPPPAHQAVELREPSGAPLGALLLAPPRGDIRGQRTRIGRDGTIVQLFTTSAPTGTRCAYRFWPDALR